MERGPQGETVRQTTMARPFDAFVPKRLPPTPPVELTAERSELLGRANRGLGRLDGVFSILPEQHHFLYQYVRKEAVLSSQIEGTQSSLSDLLLYETEALPGVPIDDVEEVSQYVKALNHGLGRIREGFPISSRLIREIHGVLLSSGRGSDQAPGELRKTQNWIGGAHPWDAVFVPPPADRIPDLMADLERFLHDMPARTPVLLKAALAHVQFETIHPFLDGNGRVGRLLITLLLCDVDALTEPLLYLSLYFKLNRQRYYELLQRCRQAGDWEAWIDFFLAGVVETAEGASQTARRVLGLFAEDRRRIESLGRRAGSALRVHELMQQWPVLTTSHAARHLSLSRPTITSALENLVDLGIVRQLSGRRRARVYVYIAYLDILSEGTEPIRSHDREVQRSGRTEAVP
ncbi:MAG: Fic family protein [Acidobacteriota bacterium]|jgi:Fic family protein